MKSNSDPKKGTRFHHSRFLNEARTGPATYEVTRVARGTVYYRSVDEGTGLVDGTAPYCCPVADWPRFVKAVL